VHSRVNHAKYCLKRHRSASYLELCLFVNSQLTAQFLRFTAHFLNFDCTICCITAAHIYINAWSPAEHYYPSNVSLVPQGGQERKVGVHVPRVVRLHIPRGGAPLYGIIQPEIEEFSWCTATAAPCFVDIRQVESPVLATSRIKCWRSWGDSIVSVPKNLVKDLKKIACKVNLD